MNRINRKYIYHTLLKSKYVAFIAKLLHPFAKRKNEPLIQILHIPKCFSRRHGELSANICGTLSAQVKKAKYQLNNGKWLDIIQAEPRIPKPLFTIEMRIEDLLPGTNNLKIEVISDKHQPEILSLQFEYDPKPISLPIKVEWSGEDLEVQDGYWETFLDKGEWRVRPKPGFESYDRILCVTGAFSGGRRVETDLIFRSSDREDTTLKLYGFGILPMWGGHKDKQGITPRRGWMYSIAWFHPYRNGGGVEFGYNDGDAPKKWVDSYRSFEPKTGVKYFIIAESLPVVDETGNHLYHKQRMKWWAEGETESEQWIEVTDKEGASLPSGEYAVALIAHECQVDFGPVLITSIPK